jgi:hypothetical protein
MHKTASAQMIYEYGDPDVAILTGKTEELGGKPMPVSIFHHKYHMD